jgi:multidrug/hemolysin transport system permease protein
VRTGLLLTRRNLLIFARDPAAVFFSILSALILLGLYALFLGGLQVDALTRQFPRATADDVHAFVNAWVFSGTTMIATVTTGLAALTVYVDDAASGRFQDFLVSPVRRRELVFGYLLASFIVAFTISMAIVVMGQLYLLAQQQTVMSGRDWVQAIGYVALSAAAFSAISSFFVTFLRTTGAFAAFSTVVGTLIGFLAGAYIPPGTLPTTVVNVMNALPFAHSAMLLRGPMVRGAAEKLTGGDADALKVIDDFYGVTISIGAQPITPTIATIVLASVIVVFTLGGIARIRSKLG